MPIWLRQICLVAEKLAPVIDDFKAIFAIDVCFVDPAVAAFGLENSLMPIGSNFLEVVAPVRENTAAGRYLKRRNGDGGYMVICQCDTHETQLARKARAAAINVRIAWEHEGKSFHGLQLHPADTGGAFFEIDWDAMRTRRPLDARRRQRMGQHDPYRRRQILQRGRATIGRPARAGRALEQHR